MRLSDIPLVSCGATLREFALAAFDAFAALGADRPGISRESYGRSETAALQFLEALALREGLACTYDAAQNLWIGDCGNAARPVVVGSHMDSVPHGGNYDGLAGVLAGLLCLVEFKRMGIVPPMPVVVLALRGEESAWYGRAYSGSSALFGLLQEADLARRHRDDATGRTLGGAMLDCGVDVERVRSRQRLLPLEPAGYLEVHIEQGPVLVERDWPTAAVTGIRGNIRHRQIVCTGVAGHSGTIPRWLRRDPVIAVSDLIQRMDVHWDALLQQGYDLVMTIGAIGTDASSHATSRIADRVQFSFEMRSESVDTLDSVHALLRKECAAVALERRVTFEFDEQVRSAPATLDARWVEKVVSHSRLLGLPAETIPSGAGHDAAIFSACGVPSGMIFVRNANGSHNPDEGLSIDDFMSAVSLLRAVLLDPVR